MCIGRSTLAFLTGSGVFVGVERRHCLNGLGQRFDKMFVCKTMNEKNDDWNG